MAGSSKMCGIPCVKGGHMQLFGWVYHPSVCTIFFLYMYSQCRLSILPTHLYQLCAFCRACNARNGFCLDSSFFPVLLRDTSCFLAWWACCCESHYLTKYGPSFLPSFISFTHSFPCLSLKCPKPRPDLAAWLLGSAVQMKGHALGF